MTREFPEGRETRRETEKAVLEETSLKTSSSMIRKVTCLDLVPVLGPTELMIAAAEGLVAVSQVVVSWVVAIEGGHKATPLKTLSDLLLFRAGEKRG